ncbi:hypothetical protein [Pelagicoccus sp. SDUM812002]|uniref:hypothetical protein n=1 Tax=Pelagicoccus sp. SDUM812002 TaxID=3041266 RepID=UPI00280D427B|nr:hypothetical protein [Pelagicoccus sp. SDUM812002]MDQ8185756.1 hypothetical protein [Pelagicoccus sp. SDUM812002]
MSCRTYFSKRLNLVLEIIEDRIDVNSLIELKAVHVKNGNVDEKTKVLAFSDADVPLKSAEISQLGERLTRELPQYAKAPTVIVTRQIGATASTMKLAKDVSKKQRMGVFATVEPALAFLDIHYEDLVEEFPEAVPTILRYDD